MTSEQTKKLSSIVRRACDSAKDLFDIFAQLADDALQVLSEPDEKRVSIATGNGQAAQPENRLLNREEIAEHLGVSVRTVGDLIKDGLPTIPLGKRRVQFDYEEVLTWAKDRRIKGVQKTNLRVVK